MSRAGPSSQRPLSATEELEKLEQSITLTLQGRPQAGRRWKLFAGWKLTVFTYRDRPQLQQSPPDRHD